MKVKENILKYQKRISDRNTALRKKHVLEQIDSCVDRYSKSDITVPQLISNLSHLATDLLVKQLNLDIWDKSYKRIEMMIANYLIMVHLDMYAGFNTVGSHYLYRQELGLNDKINRYRDNNSDGISTKKSKPYRNPGINSKIENEKIRENPSQYLKEQLKIYYIYGLRGCLMKLVRSINNEISSKDGKTSINENKIEEIIGLKRIETKLNGLI